MKIHTTIAMSNSVNGVDADWDEPATITYRPTSSREVEITDVRDSHRVDVWASVTDADWWRLEDLCRVNWYENGDALPVRPSLSKA